MKKLLILLIGLTTNVIFSQTINKEGYGYTEIVNVDSLKKVEIYQKLKEWVGISYKSANNVVQLDTEDKIIVKGNFIVGLSNGSISIDMVVVNDLIFSIKDYRYKIDLNINEMYSTNYPEYKTRGDKLRFYLSETPLNRDEYRMLSLKNAKEMYISMGFNEKKSNKMLADMEKIIENGYSGYLVGFSDFSNYIKNLYASIKVKVLQKEEW